MAASIALQAQGVSDVSLSASGFSYFVAKSFAHTPFAIELASLVVPSTQNMYGQVINMTIPRFQDLVGRTYMSFNVAALNNSGAAESWSPAVGPASPNAVWQDDYSRAIISEIQWLIGGVELDRYGGDQLHIEEDLKLLPDQWLGQTSGRAINTVDLRVLSSLQQEFFCPLMNYHYNEPGLYFPSVSAHLTSYGLKMTLQQFNMMCRPLASTLVAAGTYISPTTLIPAGLTQAGVAIGGAINSASVVWEKVLLDEPERESFIQRSQKYLIRQRQKQTDSLPAIASASGGNVGVTLNFNHPCDTLTFAMLPQTATGVTQAEEVLPVTGIPIQPGLFQYGGFIPGGAGVNAGVAAGTLSNLYRGEAFSALNITLNGQKRWGVSELEDSIFCGHVVPWNLFGHVPSKRIYVLLNNLADDDIQPAGTINFSRIDRVSATYTIPVTVAAFIIQHFFRNRNVLIVNSGVARVLYAS